MGLSEDKARENILRGNGRRDCDDKMNEQRERERTSMYRYAKKKERCRTNRREKHISQLVMCPSRHIYKVPKQESRRSLCGGD